VRGDIRGVSRLGKNTHATFLIYALYTTATVQTRKKQVNKRRTPTEENTNLMERKNAMTTSMGEFKGRGNVDDDERITTDALPLVSLVTPSKDSHERVRPWRWWALAR
jgi:hypothetical protein